GLKKRSGGAQGPDRRQQADGEQAFERGDRAASVVSTQRKTAAQAAAGGGPEEPGGEHNSQRNLVAVEDDDELPHENDLPDDRAESDQRQSRPYGRRRLFRTRHCDGLHRSATKTRLEFSCRAKAKRSKQYAVDRGRNFQPP